MNTNQRATALADAAQPFTAVVGRTSGADLLAWVEAELGHVEALDCWVPHGAARTRALAPAMILHVVSGNTPHAALQSLVGGLLLGSHNLMKLPRGGIPEVGEFVARLPEELRTRVEMSEELHDDWIARADAVVVYGSDETVAALRRRVPSGRTFIAHGHKASLGIVWDDPELASCAGAARDTLLFGQQGCLSPQVFYVREAHPGFARSYAEHLATAMETGQATIPADRALTVEEKAGVANLRAAYRFRAAGDLRVGLWEGGATDWTVIYEEDAWLAASPLSRVVFVKPLPDDLAAALGPAREYVGAVGLWPCTEAVAARFADLRPSRFCPIGRMQDPPWTWHNGGTARLASLVKWVDFEAADSFTG